MLRLQLISVLISATLYFGCFHLNMALFNALELHSGANWIFLPAGVRLLCTLLLGLEGAIGLLIASLIISIQIYGDMGLVTNARNAGKAQCSKTGASLPRLCVRECSPALGLVHAESRTHGHADWVYRHVHR